MQRHDSTIEIDAEVSASDVAEAAESVVDVTLIDEMLAMSVEERLRLNDRMVRTALELARQTGRASWLVNG
jgi:hypothetical protein